MKRSLTHLPKYKAEQIRDIAEAIVETAGEKLAMLILYGSYARGDWVEDEYVERGVTYSYKSDVDLLLVVHQRKDARQQAAIRLEYAIKRKLHRLHLIDRHVYDPRPTVSLITEDMRSLNKDLERGHYFFCDIKKEGVLLHNSGNHKLARRRKLDPEELQKVTRDDFRHWFKSASEYLSAFDHALKRRFYNKAAFELHQATERYFHAIALTFTRYKPKLHDLEELDKNASSQHPDFFTVFPRATEEQKRHFELLRKAYIDARYKRDYKITKRELEYLATRVRKLQRLTKKICREKIASLVS